MNLSALQNRAIKRHLCAGLRVLFRPEPLSMAEWADKHFYMSPESSYVEGQWRSDPYQIPILNMMGNEDIEEFNWEKAARVGYTKSIVIALGYFAEHKQRNQMLWQPTDTTAQGFMQQHVQPMIRDVKVVRKLAPWFGKKHSDNKLDYKKFSNSRQIFVLGGTAAANYREKSVDVAIYDELSQFDEDIEGQGSATQLGDMRLEGSSFPKSIRGSTPTRVDECQLTKAAEKADERFKRYLPCPHCGEYQTLEWGGPDVDWGIKWDSRATVLQAYYVCRHTGCVIEQRALLGMDQRGEMRSESGMVTRDGLTFYRDGKSVDPPRSVSVHIWSAYNTRTTWGKIAHKFLQVCKDPIELKGWVNTTKGEPWEEAGDKLDADHLYLRREHYPAPVPQAAVVLVAGVDVHPDRLEGSVWAFGGDARGTESWLIEHQVFPGDANKWDVWERLSAWRHSPIEHESGVRLRIAACCIDTGGHNTAMVYKYCKQHALERVFAIRGSSQPGMPLVGRPSKNNKGNVNLYSIGTDTAKESILGRLQISEPGPGYVHFPVAKKIDREYFEQLTSEKRVPRKKDGRIVKKFEPVRDRNEALDCYVYALAALEILNPDYPALAARLQPEEPEPEERDVLVLNPEPPKPKKRRRRNSARRVGGIKR
ncbi:terminase gpA endonuclease subunit [uncultured Microbulbifer sp.]|uniref:phage terminase large subunit family protein n=1 Tax=uncultured Microbulbifer sp. TaxID=348147 RepID=UPI00261BF3C6|nr:terminase gpA endonuclease subunit [uncultured Microbulbifer sp.]